MRDPAFWWREPGLAARLLAPVATLYGAIAGRRMRRPGTTVTVPVVCIGNLTLGGAGKTPTAIAVARLLQDDGRRPVFLTRGYGGRLVGPALVATGSSAADAGDEPLLLARAAPTIVARDRPAGAAAAIEAEADVIVMDDGLQNPALDKTAALVVVDGRRGIGNARVFPAGPLRAPLATQLDRTHAVLVIGEPSGPAKPVLTAAQARGLPVFAGRLVPDPAALAGLRGKPLLAYAGIGDPEKFFTTLAAHRLAVEETVAFPDHHRFTGTDVARLLGAARKRSLTLVTTEKDCCRMQGEPRLERLAAASLTLPVTLALDDEDGLRNWLGGRIKSDLNHERPPMTSS